MKISEQNLKVTGSANETTMKYKSNWLSHSVTMSEDGIPNKVLKYNLVGSWSFDITKRRWVDEAGTGYGPNL
jgi:hypothetical protein